MTPARETPLISAFEGPQDSTDPIGWWQVLNLPLTCNSPSSPSFGTSTMRDTHMDNPPATPNCSVCAHMSVLGKGAADNWLCLSVCKLQCAGHPICPSTARHAHICIKGQNSEAFLPLCNISMYIIWRPITIQSASGVASVPMVPETLAFAQRMTGDSQLPPASGQVLTS